MVSASSPTAGQNVIIMPVGGNSATAKTAAEMLYSTLDMRVTEISFKDHADLMAIVQGMPHLVQRIIGAVLAKIMPTAGITLAKLREIGSANYLCSEWALARTLALGTSVSNDVILDMLKTDTGLRITSFLAETVEQTLAAASDGGLVDLFETNLRQLDPQGAWTAAIKEETDELLGFHASLRRADRNSD
jgi:prephenate dehydrogenase